VMVFAILGFIFIIVYFVFGIAYKSTTENSDTVNLIYFFIWNFVEPICLQVAQFIIVYNAVRPTPNKAPFGRMLSVSRRPMSRDETKLRNVPKHSLSKKSLRSLRSMPEIEIKSIKSVMSNGDNNDDFSQLPPTPLTHYIIGYQYDNIEVPVEYQKTHHRRDSSIEAPSIASTTYFSTTQSVHSRNNSLYSLQFPSSQRTSKRLSPQLNSYLLNGIESEGGMETETSKRSTRDSSLFIRHLPKLDSLRNSDGLNEFLDSQSGKNVIDVIDDK